MKSVIYKRRNLQQIQEEVVIVISDQNPQLHSDKDSPVQLFTM